MSPNDYTLERRPGGIVTYWLDSTGHLRRMSWIGYTVREVRAAMRERDLDH
jgi:hypothetical protein